MFSLFQNYENQNFSMPVEYWRLPNQVGLVDICLEKKISIPQAHFIWFMEPHLRHKWSSFGILKHLRTSFEIHNNFWKLYKFPIIKSFGQISKNSTQWPPLILKKRKKADSKEKLNKISDIGNIINTHWLPYRKSYKATCINKISTCLENSWLQKGDLLVDGGSSTNGELALGRNLFSIYMPWEGYNFEDAILIHDRVAQAYSTIHVDEFSIKINQNELISKIIQPKTWINQGDILVSKKRKLENNFLINRLLIGMEQLKKN